MKAIFLIIIIASLCLASCGKHNDDSIPLKNFETIYYKNFNPDTIINLYYPDTTSSFDLDHDSIMDIRFYWTHWIESYGPHPHDCYKIWIEALDSLGFDHKIQICDIGCSAPFDSTMYINVHDKIYTGYGLLETHLWYGCNCFYKKYFIGVILNKNGINFLGWIHLQVKDEYSILIDDFAILKSSSDSIKVGQH